MRSKPYQSAGGLTLRFEEKRLYDSSCQGDEAKDGRG